MASCEKCAAGRRADLRALEELEKHHQVRRDGDRVYPLRDPVRVYARVPCPSVTCDKEHDPHAWAGAPLDQVCPEAGGKWESAQLDEMYAAMWEASPDIKVTEALREFNDSHFRHVEGVPHLHYVSRQMITRARKRLREAGRLDRVAKPVLCRRADQYVTLERAVWDVRSGAAPERLASMRAHYIRVVQPDPARLAHRDAYAAHVLAITRPDFAALFQMADKTYQGAEPPPPAPAWWVQVPAPPPPRL